jgi:hypothetical protein
MTTMPRRQGLFEKKFCLCLSVCLSVCLFLFFLTLQLTSLICTYQGCQMVYFQTKNPNLGKILEGFAMENVVMFYEHWEYFSLIWYNLYPFGIFCGHLVYFSRFGMFGPRKIWQPWYICTHKQVARKLCLKGRLSANYFLSNRAKCSSE